MVDVDVSPRRASRSERESKGDRRERDLLATAEHLLVTGGFAHASIADIAQAAGLSRASFYFYFTSKQALLASVIDAAVATFNARIAADTAPQRHATPTAAVRATVEAASQLWWEHATVLVASVELGAGVPEVYARTEANLAVVAEPTVALLRRAGRVPEAADPVEAAGLVRALIHMTERCFYDLMRAAPTPAERDALTVRLTRVWLRAFGLPEDADPHPDLHPDLKPDPEPGPGWGTPT